MSSTWKSKVFYQIPEDHREKIIKKTVDLNRIDPKAKEYDLNFDAYYAEHKNLILYSRKSETGKSFDCAWIIWRAQHRRIHRGVKPLWIEWLDCSTLGDSDEYDIKRYENCDLLVMDDIDKIPIYRIGDMSDVCISRLHRIGESRTHLHKKTTFTTSQKVGEEWNKMFGGENIYVRFAKNSLKGSKI